jgi:type II secretory pathway component PulM
MNRERLVLWWQALSTRERGLVGSLVPLLLGVLLYVGLVEPLQNSVSTLATAREARIEGLQRLEALAAEARTLQRRGGAQRGTPPSGVSLLTSLDETARAAGLGPQVERIVPVGEREASVVLRGALQSDLMGWLVQLRTGLGIEVRRATLDRAEAPGTVNASLELFIPEGT